MPNLCLQRIVSVLDHHLNATKISQWTLFDSRIVALPVLLATNPALSFLMLEDNDAEKDAARNQGKTNQGSGKNFSKIPHSFG